MKVAHSITPIFDKYTHVEELKVYQHDQEVTRERIVRPDAVAAVVYNRLDQHFIFVDQYRPGPNKTLLEIVAGKIDDQEDPQVAIIREIEEEVGYKVEQITVLVPFFYTSPGYSTERIQIYYAVVSEKISSGGGIDDEEITIISMNQGALNIHLKLEDEFVDGKTLLALQTLKIKHLFPEARQEYQLGDRLQCVRAYTMDTGEIAFSPSHTYEIAEINPDAIDNSQFMIVDDQNFPHYMDALSLHESFILLP